MLADEEDVKKGERCFPRGAWVLCGVSAEVRG